jgi:hypothetical protein
MTALRLALIACVAPLVFASGAASRPGTSHVPPEILLEPAFTRGERNTIRWEQWPADGWDDDGADNKPSDRRRFIVHVKELASGAAKTFVVGGQEATSVTIAGDQLPGGSPVDGRTYEFRVQRSERTCTGADKVFRHCYSHSNNESVLSVATRTTHDAVSPAGTIAIEGGALFTNRLTANVQLVALDPGTNPSGVGYVQFSETGSFSCPITAFTCVTAYAPQKQVALAPGPDGLRVLYARFYDNARGPAGSATPSLGERSPPGNVSAPTSDTIVLDTRGPALSVTRSAEPAMMNVPVSFDASGSRDEAGFGADSGLDAGTAVWRFGDGTSASGLAVTHTYRAAGSFTAELSIRDRAGNETRSELPVTVLPSGTPGGATTTTTPPTQTPDTTDRLAPTLAGVGVRRRAGRGTLLFRLSEAATVVVELRRLRPRPVRSFGRVTRTAVMGVNRLVLPSRFARVLRRRGTYELLVVARDSSGNASQIRRPRVVTR